MSTNDNNLGQGFICGIIIGVVGALILKNPPMSQESNKDSDNAEQADNINSDLDCLYNYSSNRSLFSGNSDLYSAVYGRVNIMAKHLKDHLQTLVNKLDHVINEGASSLTHDERL